MTDINTISTITTEQGETVIERKAVEIVQIRTPGAQGAKGDDGEAYNFTGGAIGQAWAVLPSGQYGWDDIRRPDKTIVPFINEHLIETTYTDAFNDRVYILSGVDVEGHLISVNNDGIVSDYESVGLIKINNDNEWDIKSKRMGFKDTQSANYVVFDDTVNSWVHGDMGDHDTGYVNSSAKTVLSSIGILPKSYGNINININYDSIESKHFSLCDPKVEHFTNTNVMQVSFSGLPQTGFIIL